MKMSELPVFVVSEVHPDSPQLAGRVSRWLWVGEGHIAYLHFGAGSFLEGRFCNVQESTRSASFAFTSPDLAPRILPGDWFHFLDGYWGGQAVIALDRSRDWQKLTFVPRDAIKTYWDGRQEEIPGGWDHEHCQICWAVISLRENTVFMQSNQEDRVCLDCFRNYVEPRNIDFVIEG